MLKYFLWPAVIIFIFCTIAAADFYKWEDENGLIHITDYPPPSKKMQKNVKVHKYENEDKDSSTLNRIQRDNQMPAKATSARSQSNSEVTIYTVSWCKYCRMAREFLRSRNVNFTEYDVEKDKEAGQRMKQLGGSGSVPFALINGQIIQGYSESAYRNALK